MEFDKIFSAFLILITLILSIYIYKNISQSTKAPSLGPPIIPFKSEKKRECSSEKVPCNPFDDNSCDNLCDDTEKMKCVNVKGVNGDENLCLPKEPDINCNSQNGGRYIWTGYGFTQSKDWQCLCTRPEIYNGPDCNTKNPSYCSNGTLSSDINTPLRNICNCDESKGMNLLFRNNNTPMCVSNDPKVGGGIDGLYGNYHINPDWRNVYFMRTNIDDWARDINKEFKYGDSTKTSRILSDNVDDRNVLNQKIVDELIKLDPVFTTSNSSFDPNYRIEVPYRYFTQTYIP